MPTQRGGTAGVGVGLGVGEGVGEGEAVAVGETLGVGLGVGVGGRGLQLTVPAFEVLGVFTTPLIAGSYWSSKRQVPPALAMKGVTEVSPG